MCAMPEYASRRLMFFCGIAIRLPATTEMAASVAMSGTQNCAAVPTPSTYRRKIAMNPAVFGAMEIHATNGVFAA